MNDREVENLITMIQLIGSLGGNAGNKIDSVTKVIFQ